MLSFKEYWYLIESKKRSNYSPLATYKKLSPNPSVPRRSLIWELLITLYNDFPTTKRNDTIYKLNLSSYEDYCNSINLFDFNKIIKNCNTKLTSKNINHYFNKLIPRQFTGTILRDYIDKSNTPMNNEKLKNVLKNKTFKYAIDSALSCDATINDYIKNKKAD